MKRPETSASSPLTVTDLPPPPTNSFQLEAELRKIGQQPEMIYRYLRVSALFEENRAASVLCNLLVTRSSVCLQTVIICCQCSSDEYSHLCAHEDKLSTSVANCFMLSCSTLSLACQPNVIFTHVITAKD